MFLRHSLARLVPWIFTLLQIFAVTPLLAQDALIDLSDRGCIFQLDASGKPEKVVITTTPKDVSRDLSKLRQFTQLREVSITSQALDAGDVRLFPKLEQVKVLRLGASKDGYDSFIERFRDLLPGLRYLSLDGPNLSGDAVSSVGELKDLERLMLLQTKALPPNAFRAIGGLPKLRTLTFITDSEVDADALRELAVSKSLKELTIGFRRLKDPQLRAIAGIKTLNRLNIGHTISSNVTSEGVEALIDLNELNTLSLRTAAANEMAIESLAKIKTLRHLSLSLGDAKQDRFIKTIPLLTNVEFLEISQGVSDDEVAVYLGLPNLRALRFGSSAISEKGIAQFFESGKLKGLSLTAERISSDNFPRLQNHFPGLRLTPSKVEREK